MFGLVLVKVEVNGRPAVLIVATSKGSGFAGAGVFTKATLKVGPITRRGHKIVAMDVRASSKSLGQKADGLLGMDFFGEFELVVVDLKCHKLILKP
jgi:hypothetical protein